MEDLAIFVSLCKKSYYTFNELPFCFFREWIKVRYTTVDNIELVKDEYDVLVTGREGTKLMFTFRHVVKTEAPDFLTKEDVFLLHQQNGDQRIHISEIPENFRDWIKERYPDTRYIHIRCMMQNEKGWRVIINKDCSFTVLA